MILFAIAAIDEKKGNLGKIIPTYLEQANIILLVLSIVFMLLGALFMLFLKIKQSLMKCLYRRKANRIHSQTSRFEGGLALPTHESNAIETINPPMDTEYNPEEFEKEFEQEREIKTLQTEEDQLKLDEDEDQSYGFNNDVSDDFELQGVDARFSEEED